jgi:hypothetical protein
VENNEDAREPALYNSTLHGASLHAFIPARLFPEILFSALSSRYYQQIYIGTVDEQFNDIYLRSTCLTVGRH